MTSKQRAYLRSLAMTMEPIFQVGKSSITPEFTEAIAEALEARELIKKELEQDEMPSVDVIHYYREFDKDVTEFSTQIKEMKERVEGASSDEARAKKQLVKFLIIQQKHLKG